MKQIRTKNDLLILAYCFYPTLPVKENALLRTCRKRNIPLGLAGLGQYFTTYGHCKIWETVKFIKAYKQFRKIIICDYEDTAVAGKGSDIYDRLPSDGILWSTDYQKLPYLMLSSRQPVYPFGDAAAGRGFPEFRCFYESPDKLFAPNGGAFGGNPDALIAAFERMQSYQETFAFKYYDKTAYPYLNGIGERDMFLLCRDDQHLENMLFYEKMRYEKDGKTFPIKIQLDKEKTLFTSSQPNCSDGDALFFHFPGAKRTPFGNRRLASI